MASAKQKIRKGSQGLAWMRKSRGKSKARGQHVGSLTSLVLEAGRVWHARKVFRKCPRSSSYFGGGSARPGGEASPKWMVTDSAASSTTSKTSKAGGVTLLSFRKLR